MAGTPRHWKEQNGRFYARIAVPARLRPFLDSPRSELVEPLGADRRVALRQHAAAIARLQHQLTLAAQRAHAAGAAPPPSEPPRTPITTADFGRAIWERYTEALAHDEAARAQYPRKAEVDAARASLVQRATAGEFPNDRFAAFEASLDYLVMREARSLDRSTREIRLAALQRELADGETHQVEHEIDAYLDRHGLSALPGTAEREVLAKQLMRAEIEVLRRTLERDEGDFGGQPTDPIVKPAPPLRKAERVSLSKLWADYLAARMQAGFIRDGGKRQEPVIRNLRVFLGHDDAQRVTRKDVIAWRDHLLGADGLGAKTINDIYLSTVRSIFTWAHENERLPENVAATVRQPKPRKVRSRERGYTDVEALAVLRASRAHQPRPNQFGFVRETAHMTAAKRWAPLLCAFSGARISEITQLRKEDIRREGKHHVMRITPDAGTVKTGAWRDVPLHRQVIAEGFLDFIAAAADGPLFHGATDPANYATAAATVSDELAKWLRRGSIAPEGVQPNHAWRHRFKTVGRELGLSDRVIDAIQGHAGRTAGDSYGDVTLAAKARAIDALPDIDLSGTAAEPGASHEHAERAEERPPG